MEVQTLETFDSQLWDAVAPHPMVSWEWGEARKQMGIDVLHIGEFDGQTLKDAYQITFHAIPHTNMTVGYMPRTTIPSKVVLQEIKLQAQKRKAIFVKMEPYVRKESIVNDTSFQEFQALTTPSPHPMFPLWTQMLDLSKSEEELAAAMKPKWRYNMGLAERKAVTVREMTNDEGFEHFAKLYFETTGRQDYAGHTREYHKIIFDTLKGSMSHILIAFYNNIPLSAYHLLLFNGVLYYPYGGSAIIHRDVMASNLLMWETIRFGIKHGAHSFDMWGSLGPDYDRSAGGWAGFSRFKEGYGTEFVEFVGSYDYVLNPTLYRVYNVADVIRKKLLL